MSTRERIIEAARALFAERGYRGTSVGDVEAAAGLVPRRGALYKHFASKDALLLAVIEAHAGMDDLTARVVGLDLGDLEAELAVIARIGLDELRRERDLIRIVMKEGERVPEVAAAFERVVVRRSQDVTIAWMAHRLGPLGVEIDDPPAVAAVLVGALVAHVLEEILFGPGVREIDDDRLVAAWVRTATALLSPDPRSAVS